MEIFSLEKEKIYLTNTAVCSELTKPALLGMKKL